MIIIGEKINGSSESVRQAIDGRDSEAIARLAQAQSDAGADYIDVNAGIFREDEAARLEWLVRAIQERVRTRFSLDTSSAGALAPALKANANGKPIINSITAQKGRFDAVIPLVREYGASVIALCMDDGGLPDTAEGRVRIAGGLVEKLAAAGVCPEDIFIDPVVSPISSGPRACTVVLESIREIRRRLPGVHTVCGLSNISYGMPARALLNRTFLAMAMAAGLDGAILDPLDRGVMAAARAAGALTGDDENGMRFLAMCREGGIA